MQEPLVCLMFDRSGGALARFGADYWHGYDEMDKLADDFCRYVRTGEVSFLPRNEKRDYEWPAPNPFAAQRGQAVWYTYGDIVSMTDGASTGFPDADLFFRALKSRSFAE